MNKIVLIFVLSILGISSCNNEKALSQVMDSNKEIKKPEQEKTKELSFATVDYVMGKFQPKDDEAFVTIPIRYADREGMYLRKEVLDAFVKMYDAAKEDGVHLVIRSATRNFEYQKGIWERKWTGQTILSDGTNVAKDIPLAKAKALKILEYSSMPGSSRHHWGTDIDFNSFENSWFETGEGLILFNWLEKHAADYGFCRPYCAKGDLRQSGYNEEKWHWSYMPLSKPLTRFAERRLKNEMIKGFKGDEVTEEIDVVGNYVLGIHPECK